MAFDYRFERVMKLAENEKQNLEIQYQKLFADFEHLAQQLIHLIERKKDVQSGLQQQMSCAITIDQMKMGITDVNNLESMISVTSERYTTAKIRLERFQARLQEKATEVKVYEKLKEKQRLIYRKLEGRAEMRQMDDIAGRRAVNL